MWDAPSTDRIDWAATCGAAIPTRTTIATTISAGASLTTINNAIAACPSGQVVFLSAGTYTISGTISLNKDGVTLRGAGQGVTIINSSNASACIESDDYSWFGNATGRTINSGATKGSTQIVLASGGTDFHVGELMQIDGADDITKVFATEGPGRHIRMTHICTAVSGNTITFDPPLAYDLSGNTPKAYGENYPPSGSSSGVESMTINSTAGANSVIETWNSYKFFVYDCEVTGAGNAFIQFNDSLQPTVKHCKIHTAQGFLSGTNTDGFGVYPYNNSSFWLVEDNVFYELWSAMFVSGGSPGAVIYNFVTNCNTFGSDRQLPGFNSNHGPCPAMVLWEGNSMNQWQNDGYHGNAIYQHLFRNYIHGIETGRMKNVKLIDANRGSLYHYIVGNVLGSSAVAALTGLAYKMTGTPDYEQMPVIFRLGYPNQGNNDTDETVDNTWQDSYTITYPDAAVESTAMIHGNYDYKNATITNVVGQDTTLPSSLFYAAKPTYFGTLAWPPYNASSPSSASVDDIPAGYRYTNGFDPPVSSGQTSATAGKVTMLGKFTLI